MPANPRAWNGWYHIIGSTYGTWLPGDARGFRSFGHRQHIQGDYRNPPPAGAYAPLLQSTRTTLKHPPVQLDADQRRLVCAAMIERLVGDGADVVALAVAPHHFHLLARFAELTDAQRQRYARTLLRDGRDPAARHFVGLARKQASLALSRAGRMPSSPVWARRPKVDPIRDRGHQVNVARYIVDHRRQGAAVYRVNRGFMGPQE